jgi:hypothetical protein
LRLATVLDLGSRLVDMLKEIREEYESGDPNWVAAARVGRWALALRFAPVGTFRRRPLFDRNDDTNSSRSPRPLTRPERQHDERPGRPTARAAGDALPIRPPFAQVLRQPNTGM